MPKAVLFLGRVRWPEAQNQLGDLVLPIAAIRGETSGDYLPPEETATVFAAFANHFPAAMRWCRPAGRQTEASDAKVSSSSWKTISRSVSRRLSLSGATASRSATCASTNDDDDLARRAGPGE